MISNPYQPYIPNTFSLPTYQQPQQNNGSGIIWVQGISGAKAYPVSPGNTVWLMDSENMTFYMKSTDTTGMPLPLKVFDYKERVETAEKQPEIKLDDYVSKEEFEKLKESVDKILQRPEYSNSTMLALPQAAGGVN